MPFPLMALVHEGSHCLGLIICGERKEEEEDGRSLSSEEEEEEVSSAKIAQDAPAVLGLLLHREGLKDKIASLDKSAGWFESIDRRLLPSLSVSLGKKSGKQSLTASFAVVA